MANDHMAMDADVVITGANEVTTTITVGSLNIEKTGISSPQDKQAIVSSFIEICYQFRAEVIFLCEVHSARTSNYISHLNEVYGNEYDVNWLDGGHSNAYLLLTKKSCQFVVSQYTLENLNRGILLVQVPGKFMLCLAHFKSGQTGLTRNQIEGASAFLDSAQRKSWAIIGDMNWDFYNARSLTLPADSHSTTCWLDHTQEKGNILDWCLAGRRVTVIAHDLKDLPSSLTDFSGPDHRPVVFSITYPHS